MADAPDELTTRSLDGDLYVYNEEDIADISAEVFVWTRELPELDDETAGEIADMVYELATDGYHSHGEPADDSDYKVN